jgi:hypothetical protein
MRGTLVMFIIYLAGIAAGLIYAIAVGMVGH